MQRNFKIDPARHDEFALQTAADALRKGLLVVHPTETFYGLGAIYSDEKALDNLFRVKGRDMSKPVLLLIRDIATLLSIAHDVPLEALDLARRFWPGPLTLLVPASSQLSPLLTGVDLKIGCRITSNPIAQKLLEYVDAPMTSTSANISGEPSPASIDELSPSIRYAAAVILDGGHTRGGLPSTVLDVTAKPFRVVREGALSPEQIFNAMQEQRGFLKPLTS